MQRHLLLSRWLSSRKICLVSCPESCSCEASSLLCLWNPFLSSSCHPPSLPPESSSISSIRSRLTGMKFEENEFEEGSFRGWKTSLAWMRMSVTLLTENLNKKCRQYHTLRYVFEPLFSIEKIKEVLKLKQLVLLPSSFTFSWIPWLHCLQEHNCLRNVR